MTAPPPDGKTERTFVDFAKNLQSVGGVLLGLLTATPATSRFVPFVVPAWPESAWVIGMILVALATCITFLSCRDEDVDTLKARSKKLIIPLIVLFCSTTILASAFIVGGNDVYLTKGLFLTDEARAAIDKGAVSSDAPKDLLNAFGYDSADRIWRWRWITQSLTSLSYAATGALLAHILTLNVLIGTPRRKPNPEPAG